MLTPFFLCFSKVMCYNVREQKIKRRKAAFDFRRDNEQAVWVADNKHEVRACEYGIREGV